MRVLIKKKGEEPEQYYCAEDKDFHTRRGMVKKEELAKKPGSTVRIGAEEFALLEPSFLDDYKRLRRLAQIITLKDLGSIIAHAGITKDSKVIEAGAGSGAATCYLASVAKKVVSYERDERGLEVAKENVAKFKLGNVIIKRGDVYESGTVTEKDMDVFLLDLTEPWNALATVKKALKIGGYLVCYLPNILQVQTLVKSLDDSFLQERTIEVIEREWVVDERRSRPVTKDHAHTAFLVFLRRIE